MTNSFQSGFAHIALLLLLIAGLFIGVYLVGQKTFYSPKANASTNQFIDDSGNPITSTTSPTVKVRLNSPYSPRPQVLGLEETESKTKAPSSPNPNEKIISGKIYENSNPGKGISQKQKLVICDPQSKKQLFKVVTQKDGTFTFSLEKGTKFCILPELKGKGAKNQIKAVNSNITGSSNYDWQIAGLDCGTAGDNICQESNVKQFDEAADTVYAFNLTSSSSDADTDNDGFSDIVEGQLGTDPLRGCPLNQNDNAWPVDTSNNSYINGQDVSLLVPYTNGTKPYNKRYDLNLDGKIDAADVEIIKLFFLSSCTPVASPTPSPSPQPIYTTQVVLAEDPNFSQNSLVVDYTTSPLELNYTFSDSNPGQKNIYAKFLNSDGLNQTEQNASPFPMSIQLLAPTPSPSPTSSPQNQVKALVLRYFPTDPSGTMIDTSVTGNINGSLTMSLSDLRNRVSSMTNESVTKLTDATKYHGYKDPTAQPSISYQVYEDKEFLKPIPASTNKIPWNSAYRPDYYKILTEDVNICNLVDNLGVRQVWMWGYHTDKIEPVESDMSMGTDSRQFWNYLNYGDVSNSERINDLPICKKTYVLYNYNFGRGVGEVLEDHGHHVESVMKFADASLWDKFENPHGNTTGINRCGWTHSPPNVTNAEQYNWRSERVVDSDCMDWKPDGGGVVSQVSCHTWYGAACLDDTGAGFKVWWMQNIPGLNNNLTYQSKRLKNWWSLYADLDIALLSGLYLTEQTLPPQVEISDNFNKPDNATSLGTTLSGNAWTIEKGQWGIANSQAYPANGCPAPGYATIETGVTDGRVEVTLPINRQDMRIPFRFVNLDNSYWVENVGSIYVLTKRQNGSQTELARSTNAPADGDQIRIDFNSSIIKVYKNGVSIMTASDSSIKGTKAGIGNWCSGAIRFDNFLFTNKQL